MAKNYIKGSIRKINVGSEGDSKLIVSLSLEQMTKIANDKGYVNMVIQERRDTDAFGNTHYAYENDYNPNEKSGAAATSTQSTRSGSGSKSPLKAPTYKEPSNPFE